LGHEERSVRPFGLTAKLKCATRTIRRGVFRSSGLQPAPFVVCLYTHMKLFWVCLSVFSLLIAGCSSVRSHAEPGHSFAGRSRFFVVSNLNDNHAVDQRITAALRTRGFTAEYGPRTLMADDAEVLISYTDRWTWDFSDHLVYLQIAAGKPQGEIARPYASVTYRKNVELSTKLDEVVGRLVDELLKTK
jgi:uncharacterized protein YceK